ncbi:MAG: nucleotidyltransferase domain-containing protein [Candidatus Sericytochromatia bacterium]|nr:nucleotidyltransferase domain-containing protein [Candidatus Sericytochromatia bacterium]
MPRARPLIVGSAVRLNEQQQQAIVTTFHEVFGEGRVLLFGSRTDDTRKGGDIDLYAQPAARDALMEKRVTFLARLKRRIGEQKVDLVIASDPARPIEQAALQQGILLCPTR